MKYPLALFDFQETDQTPDTTLSPFKDEYDKHKLWYHKGKWWEYPFALRNVSSFATYESQFLDIGTGKSVWPHIMLCDLFEGCLPAENITLIDYNLYLPAFKGIYNCIKRNFNPSVMSLLRHQSFTVITCLSVIEHMTLNEARSTFRLIEALLKPGGIAVFTTDLCEDSKKPIKIELKKPDGSDRYVNWNMFDFGTLRILFKEMTEICNLELVVPYSNVVIDLAKDMPAYDDLWADMNNIMDKFHQRMYTSCGWVLRKKNV